MRLSVGFVSLGCSKNLVDTQLMAGFLKRDDITLAHSPEEADIILVNTCAFIQDAREEAADAILAACEQKRAGGCRAVIVAGCMVQRYREKLAKAFPDVDAFLGVDNLESVSEIVQKLEQGKRPKRVQAGSEKPAKIYNPAYPTLLFTGGPFAYLKISEGCDHRCAFCAIPGIRGPFRSRPEADLLREAKAMIGAGVKEINLIAQDVLRYGRDFAPDRKPRIASLLRKLDKLDGDFQLRLLYGYPSAVTDEILELLATSKHLCRYLDVPVQHCNPSVLKAMGRADAIDATLGFAERLRKAVPGITLRTTCLVGFPGETDAAFAELLDYVKVSRFDHLGTFVYSPEEGTRALLLPDVPDLEIAEARRDALMAAQQKIVRERARSLVGQRDRALLLRAPAKKGGAWTARLPRQAPDVDGETRVKNVPADAKAGDFLPVKITGARGYDLLAEAICQKGE